VGVCVLYGCAGVVVEYLGCLVVGRLSLSAAGLTCTCVVGCAGWMCELMSLCEIIINYIIDYFSAHNCNNVKSLTTRGLTPTIITVPSVTTVRSSVTTVCPSVDTVRDYGVSDTVIRASFFSPLVLVRPLPQLPPPLSSVFPSTHRANPVLSALF